MNTHAEQETGRLPRRWSQSLSGLHRTLALVWQSGPGWTLLSMLLIPIQGLLPLCTLYLLKLIVDTLILAPAAADKGAMVGQLGWLVGLTALVALIGEICRAFARLGREALSDLVTQRVHNDLHAKAVEVDLESYERPDYYDALHRAHQEAAFRPTNILFGLMMVAQNSILIAAISGWLFSVDWRIGVALLLSVLPGFWARVVHARRMYHWRHRRTPLERQASYFGWLLTDPTMAKEMRLFALGPHFAQRFSELRTLLRGERLALGVRRCLWDLATDAVAIVAIFGSYSFVILRAVQGLITVGDVAMFYQAFLRMQSGLRDLMTHLSGLYEDRLFLSTLDTFLGLPSRVVAPTAPKPVPRPMQTGFAFHDVSFRYPGAGEYTLRDVSLEIRPHEVIALVGENGSGKTTLVKLLCRLYDPNDGVITLDGIDLREFDPHALWGEIGAILQDYGRYSLSARENIWFGDIRQPLDGDGTVAAAERTGADEVIARMPRGYDTVLGKRFEDGTELSVGDWQKLALARAFFHDAQLIVLDEPTSSMDAQAEDEVLRGFRDQRGGAAAVLISHRLSTMRLADRIFVLEQGRIAQHGTHAELIEQAGTYARLFNLQASAYRKDRGPC